MEIEYLIKALEGDAVISRNELNGLEAPELVNMSLTELQKERYKLIIEVIRHPEFQKQIDDGHITLAMIKPAQVNLPGVSDEEAAEKITAEIKKPLIPIVSIPVKFSAEDVEEFYSGQKAELESQTEPGESQNKWDKHIKYMSEAATTIIILYRPIGSAIKEWRDQIGHWNVVDNRDPNTIRGRWAKNNSTSIVHGSDSIGNVKREIGIVLKNLERLSK